VIRRETTPDGRVLQAILNFVGRGDELFAPSVHHLAAAFGGLPNLLVKLDACGAHLTLLHEQLSTIGDTGALLRRAIAATAELRGMRVRRKSASPADAAALSAAGARPSDIARTLQVSRMTVWRWLKQSPDGQLRPPPTSAARTSASGGASETFA
jgi:hypothetical protein